MAHTIYNVIHTLYGYPKNTAVEVFASFVNVFRKSESSLLPKHTANNRANTTPSASSSTGKTSGDVFLVGAGPGDPDLLTIKALKAIQQADVILVDWLVNNEILKLIPAHVEQKFVGKRAGLHSMKQSQINALMVDLALQGKRVVRLKGGDPAIFGRTAEEVKALQAHDIDYAIIPGITAASGASAYSGVPLTLRDCATSVKLITAHLKNPETEPDWSELAKTLDHETIVFYMGLGRLSQITDRLQAVGVCSSMSVAVVDQATTKQQRTCTGELANIDSRVKAADFMGPSLIIVGNAVGHRFNVNKDLLTQLSQCSVLS